jgi:integration host factor subunit alpha
VLRLANTILDRVLHHSTTINIKGNSYRLFKIIKQTLASGEDVLISGFGKWSAKQKQERRGRNPQTGEPLILAPRKVVRFKCASVLKDKLNRKS